MHLECLTENANKIAPKIFLLANDFVLAGGTALALQIGHRVSVDFDFFCKPSAFPKNLNKLIHQEFENIQILQDSNDTFEAIINGVKCSFFSYETEFSDSKVRFYKRPLATIEDIAAMKLIAIAQRGAKKDFVDLFFITQTLEFIDIVENLKRRYDWTKINPIHYAKSLVYFDDADCDPDPVYLSSPPNWQTLKEEFNKNLPVYTKILNR